MKPRLFFYILLTALLAVLVAGGAGYYYATGLVSQQSQTLKLKLADQQVDQQQIVALNRLKRQYDAVQPDLPLLNQALPRTKDQSQVVLQLEQLAAGNGMSLSGVIFSSSGGQLPSATSGSAAGPGGVLALPIQLTLTGSYNQMEGFLQGVETLNRYADVASLAITTNKPGSVTFSTKLNVFFKP